MALFGEPLNHHAASATTTDTLSPPSSPLPTPTRSEVPGTPQRNTPQSSGLRRNAVFPPWVLFPEALDFYSAGAGAENAGGGLARSKRKMEARLAMAERPPLNFAEKIKVQRLCDESTHRTEDFDFQGELGRGSYSTVHRVLHRIDARPYALKRVHRHVTSAKAAWSMVQKEHQMHLFLKDDEHIVQASGLGCSETECFLLTELCEGGSFAAEIEARRQAQKHYEETQLLQILCDLAAGLAAMHRLQLVHNDLKPANVFIKHTGQGAVYKIGDLGHAAQLLRPSQVLEPGDSKYMAQGHFDQSLAEKTKLDVFSLGITMLEAASLQSPPSAGPQWEMLRHQGPPRLDRYSASFNALLSRMLEPSHDARPSAEQLLEETRKCLALPVASPAPSAPESDL